MSAILRLSKHESKPIEFAIKLYESLEIGRFILKTNDFKNVF